MQASKDKILRALKNISIVTGAISIAFLVTIALVMSGVSFVTSAVISLSISLVYLVYRVLTFEMVEMETSSR